MRDYALSRARNFELGESTFFLARIISNWRTRRELARLSELDDFLLRDIGVTRADVRWAAGLPLTANAVLALEERSLQRRHHNRA